MSVNTITATIDNLKKDFDNSNKTYQQNRDNALREAYVVNQKEMRQLPQSLSAQGANGGAVQSSYADIANAYQKARQQANADYDTNYGNLRLQYDKNLNTLNAQLADAQEAEAQAAAARASSSRSRSSGSSSGSSYTKSTNSTYGPYATTVNDYVKGALLSNPITQYAAGRDTRVTLGNSTIDPVTYTKDNKTKASTTSKYARNAIFK